MHETSKCHQSRIARGDFDNYLRGDGIDIGCGPDPLRPPDGTVRPWDMQDGDAQYLKSIADNTLDFVYSSHCLEHMVDVGVALWNWTRVLKPGGYLYVVIPDYTLYEKNNWPSRFNNDHKASFSLTFGRDKVRRSNHYHVLDDITGVMSTRGFEVIRVELEDTGFNYNTGFIDQTQTGALSQICFVMRKSHSGKPWIPETTIVEIPADAPLAQDEKAFGTSAVKGKNLVVRRGTIFEWRDGEKIGGGGIITKVDETFSHYAGGPPGHDLIANLKILPITPKMRNYAPILAHLRKPNLLAVEALHVVRQPELRPSAAEQRTMPSESSAQPPGQSPGKLDLEKPVIVQHENTWRRGVLKANVGDYFLVGFAGMEESADEWIPASYGRIRQM